MLRAAGELEAEIAPLYGVCEACNKASVKMIIILYYVCYHIYCCLIPSGDAMDPSYYFTFLVLSEKSQKRYEKLLNILEAD